MPDMMKGLAALNDGYAKTQPDSAELTDLSPFIELRDLPRPTPKEGQVLIKVHMAAVNPSDEMFLQGLYGQPRVEGRPVGFEGVGEVVETGGGFMAGRLKGKRVSFFAAHSGTWAEYALTDAQMCFPVSDEVKDADAAGMLVNPMTAWAMFDMVKKSGSDAFVMSAAGSQLCKFIAGLARDQGRTAIGVVRRAEQIEPLKKLGMAHVLDSSSDTFETDMRKVFKETKPRLFLDAVAGQLSSDIFDAMGPKARWAIYGRLDPKAPTLNKPEDMIFQNKSIEGFWLTNWFAKDAGLINILRARRDVQNKFKSGEWSTDVSEVVPLAEVMTALPGALRKPDGKVFIRP